MLYGVYCFGQPTDFCPDCFANNCNYCWETEDDDPSDDNDDDGTVGGGGPVLWYLQLSYCGGQEWVYCCCENSREGRLSPTLRFYCLPGGQFECTPGLGNCEPRPLDCDAICSTVGTEPCL